MLLFIECAAACAAFTLIILPSLYKDPVKHILSYPKPIRQRVESLPQYAEAIAATKKRHLARKLASVPVFALALAAVAYFSGARSFGAAFVHVFILFSAVNIYDVIVLDLLIFRRSARARIPGTEDMTSEYAQAWHHIRGGVIGEALALIAALIAAGIVHFAPLP